MIARPSIGSIVARLAIVACFFTASPFLVQNASAVTSLPTTPGYIMYPEQSYDGIYTVMWGTSLYATSYELERSEDGGVSWSQVYSGFGNTYNEFITDGLYWYRVRGTNTLGVSPWRTGDKACEVDIPGPPDTPESIVYPESDADGEYRISWSGVGEDVTYHLQRGSVASTDWQTVYGGSELRYDDTVPEGRYRYRVRATNNLGESGWCTGTWDCVVAIPTPQPTNTPTPTPTPTPVHIGFSGTQSCAVSSDGHFYAAAYNISSGQTEDTADANTNAALDYIAVPGCWFGIYVYDYDAAAWSCALHIYCESL